MQNVTVNKNELLQKVKANRGLHQSIYDKAMAAYRKQVVEKLRKLAEQAEAGGEIRTSVSLTEPANHLKDYDVAISMLEMTNQDYVELDMDGARNYLMDDWGWKHSFNASTALYLGK